MGSFGLSTLMASRIVQVSKDVQRRDCEVRRGSTDGGLDFDLEGHFQGRLRDGFVFLSGGSYF